jgi:hypothetical protein
MGTQSEGNAQEQIDRFDQIERVLKIGYRQTPDFVGTVLAARTPR